MTPLRQQFIQDMQLRRLSENTQKVYLSTVVNLSPYYSKSPDLLSEKEVLSYLHYLSHERGLAWSTCNIHASAITFLYRKTLQRPESLFKVPQRKQQKRLPEALSFSEVESLLQACLNLKQRTILMSVYGGGSCFRSLKIASL